MVDISITGMGSISPLGTTDEIVWSSYSDNKSYIKRFDKGNNKFLAAPLGEASNNQYSNFLEQNVTYKKLDKSVILAIYASRKALSQTSWDKGSAIGVNIGSSRGATALFEDYHKSFLNGEKLTAYSSPSTTLGNISSWVSQDLKSTGPQLSHSITCSTSFHSILNGIAWIQSGMCDRFVVGGSEAALTPFTIAQMKALRVYGDEALEYPSQPLNLSKTKNTMILGEGASIFCIEKKPKSSTICKIRGIGYGSEIIRHGASMSNDAECLQQSMKMALKDIRIRDVDVIVTHAPGTIKGDQAEVNAIQKIFGENIPSLTSNKWKIGHTFGASGTLSLEMAVLMLIKQKFIPIPYLNDIKYPKKIEKILVNSVGFGGNAVSILISKT